MTASTAMDRALYAGMACILAIGGMPEVSKAVKYRTNSGITGNSHPGPGAINHPVGVVPSPSISVPANWPTDPNGAITCLTCHYAIPSSKGGFNPTLRDFDEGDSDPTRFCANCHSGQAYDTAAGVHWLAVGMCHIKANSQGSAISAGGLDSESRRCLTCHDGVSAAESSFMTGGHGGFGSLGDRRRNHPVGVRYPIGKPKPYASGYRPTTMLPDVMRLPGGMVSCVSCHNLYAGGQNHLAVSNEGSALCMTCHAMN